MLRVRSLTMLSLSALALAPTLASAQSSTYVGPSVGIFFPADSKIRDAMGDSWISFGASRVKIDPNRKQNLGYDWNAFSKGANGNKVFMLAGTMGYTIPLGQPGDSTRPYFAIRGGLSYIDYALNTAPTTRLSGKRIGFDANVEFGINVGDRLNISARYDMFPEYEGLRFSGFSLALKWGVARF